MTAPAATYSCSHIRPLAAWAVYEHADGACRILPAHVQDDFGNLVPLSTDAQARNTIFWLDDRASVDESAAQWLADNDSDRRANSRALLRPAPITVEIAEPDDFGDTPIRVGYDPRHVIGAPTYRLEIAGADPAYITQAQLAALLVAGEALCRRKRATPRRKASQ